MKFYKHALLLMAIAVPALFVACGDDDDGGAGDPPEATTPAAAESAFPVTITDDNGNDLTLEAAPQAIVALAPSFVEVLFEIDAGDAIVAADENTDAPPEADSIPKISGFAPSVEGIASYDPDLVLIFYEPGGLEDALEALGIPTAYLATPQTLDGVYEQIETLGTLVGRRDEASALVTDTRAEIEAIVAQLDGIDEGPSVFHELDVQLFTAGPGSFTDEIYSLLKVQNIAESTGEPFPQMSAEAVIAADPEVIILADGAFGEMPETVAARTGWDSISAVENDRIYPVNGAILSRPSQRIADDIQELAELLYPEVF